MGCTRRVSSNVMHEKKTVFALVRLVVKSMALRASHFPHGYYARVTICDSRFYATTHFLTQHTPALPEHGFRALLRATSFFSHVTVWPDRNWQHKCACMRGKTVNGWKYTRARNGRLDRCAWGRGFDSDAAADAVSAAAEFVRNKHPQRIRYRLDVWGPSRTEHFAAADVIAAAAKIG